MDRTNAPGYAIINGKRVYQDRDKTNGISGTGLIASDRTAIQEELVGGLIEGAGLTPDANDLGQVNKALQIMYAAYERGISPYSAETSKRIGGYPLNAVVCGENPGDFFVSTTEKNESTPGADGANWQSLFDGYATQVWAAGKFQPVGDYATNLALNTEITNRTNQDTWLQTQINNRVQKTGDTIDWLTVDGGSVTTVGYSGNDGVSGGIAYATGLTSTKQTGDIPVAIYRFINQNGVGPFATIWLTDNHGNGHELRFGGDDRLRTASGNVFALTSELPLPVGMHCQIFTVDIPNPVPADGWLANIPTGWSIHSYVTGCDTGANVYVVSAKVENSTQARIWAKFPTNGALATGGTATISSFGYF